MWWRIALLSFGGPAGQIAVMHRILVDEKGWVSEARFLHALNYCMLLPGPEAQQLATYIGWLMHRTRGGLLAGGLFILPGAVAIMALSIVYALFGKTLVVAGLFFGLKAAVLAIVLQAVLRVGARALKNNVRRCVAALSFVGIFFLNLPFPLIVLSAGLAGFFAQRAGSTAFEGGAAHNGKGDGSAGAADDEDTSLLGAGTPSHARTTMRRTLRTALIWGAVWLTPVLGLEIGLGADHVFSKIALFFSQMAVVTFGGAYAVLAYVAQRAVEGFGWLSPAEMLDGLGMAETTPGPLIMVLQFVGFMAGFRGQGSIAPLVSGILGGLIATWVTFAPCFLWIFVGGPYVEALRGNRALSAALSAITAAIVGVILNLSIWFSVHTIFRSTMSWHWNMLLWGTPPWSMGFDAPVLASLDPMAALLCVAALIAIFKLRASVFLTLGVCAAAGLLMQITGLLV